MRLFLLPKTFKGENTLTLIGKEYNYLVRVLRIKEGQKVMGRDCNGNLWELTIAQIDNNTCIINTKASDKAIEYTDTLPQERPLKPIVLYQCLPKGRKLDDIIKKATEAGVCTIVLVKSHNCIADYTGKEISKIARFDAIIKEAIQQSGSVVPTTVEGPIDISKVPDDFSNKSKDKKSLGLVLHQCELKQNQSDLVQCIKDFKGKEKEGITGIVVGAEGGLTNEECTNLMKANFKAVLLKTNILRCETASIYAIGAVQTLLESSCV